MSGVLSPSPKSFRRIHLGLVALAAILVVLGTPYGPGLTPDTVLYLETADVIREELRLPRQLMEGVRPGSAVPPLYPAALALVGGGLDHLAQVRWLNVGLFAASTWLFGGLLFQLSRSSLYFSTLGTACFVCSIVMLEIHTAAWSEPLFIFLELLAIGRLTDYLQTPTWRGSVTTAALFALAPLCRFAGLTVLVAGFVAVLFFRRGRWAEIAVFSVLSALPLAILLLFNRAQSGSAAGTGEFSPYLPWADLVVLTNTMAAWVVPGIDRFQVVPGQDLLAGAIVLGMLGFYALTWRYAEVSRDHLMSVSLLFVVTYPVVILTLITLLKADLPLEQRILCPMYIGVLLTAPALAARVDLSSRVAMFGRVGFGLLLLVYLPPLVVGLRHLNLQGRGYTGPPYEAPEIYRYLKEHPSEVFHTNDTSAAWLKVRRIGKGLPEGRLEGPILYFRIGHPVPPRHQEAVKRPTAPPDEALELLVKAASARLVKRQGQVELYLPSSFRNPF